MKNSALLKLQLPSKPPRAPKGLGNSGRRLWGAIQAEYFIRDPGGLSHLLSACRAEDDLARMRATVTADGDMIEDRFHQKVPHPLLVAIRGSEAVKRQALGALNLDLEPLHDKPGRPPGR